MSSLFYFSFFVSGVPNNIFKYLFIAVCPTLSGLLVVAVGFIISLYRKNLRLEKCKGVGIEEPLVDDSEVEPDDKGEPAMHSLPSSAEDETTRLKRPATPVHDSNTTACERVDLSSTPVTFNNSK